MNKIFLALVLMFALNINCYANSERMVPLFDYVQKMDTNDFNEIGYLLYRCMSLYFSEEKVLNTRDDNFTKNAKDLNKHRQYITYNRAFTNFSRINENATYDDFNEMVFEVTQEMEKKYMYLANQNYINSGTYFMDEYFQGEFSVCNFLMDTPQTEEE